MGDVRLASAGDDIKLWDCSTYSLVKQFNPHEHNIDSICWNHDNTLISSVAVNNKKIALTALKNDVITLSEYLDCMQGNLCVDFNSTSRYLLSGGSDFTIGVWDLKTRNIKKIYKDHKGPVTCAKFNWNDTQIASGSETGEIILYNVVTGQGCSPLIKPNVQAIKDLQFSRFKKALLGSVSDDGAINLWDTNTRRLLHSYTDSHRAPATGLSFSPINDILLMSVGLDKRIVFYDVQGKKTVKTIMAENPLTSIDFMSNGAIIAVGSTRGHIYTYDLRQGSTPLKVIRAHKSSVKCLRFQNDPKRNESYGRKSTVTTATVSPPNRRQLPSAPENNPKTTHPKESEHFSPQLQVKQNNSDVIRDADDVFSPIRDGVNDHSGDLKFDSIVTDNSSLNVKSAGDNMSGGVFSPLNDLENRPQYGDGGSGLSPLYSHVDSVYTPNYTSHNTNNNSHTDINQRPSYGNNVAVTNGVAFNDESHRREPLGHQGDPVHRYNYEKHSDYIVNDGSPELPSNRSPRKDNYNTSGSLHRPEQLQTLSPRSLAGTGVSASPSMDLHTVNKLDDSPSGSAGVSVVSPSRTYQSPEGAHAVSSSGHKGSVVSRNQSGIGASETAGFHAQFIRNIIREEMEELRDQIHEEVQNLQLEMLRQFQIQQDEIRCLLQHYSVNEQLVSEVEKLREENKRLKKNF